MGADRWDQPRAETWSCNEERMRYSHCNAKSYVLGKLTFTKTLLLRRRNIEAMFNQSVGMINESRIEITGAQWRYQWEPQLNAAG